MLGAKALGRRDEIQESWDTHRRTLVVSTILLGRIALLRVATAVAGCEDKSVSIFLRRIP